jgi:hypothetical protein
MQVNLSPDLAEQRKKRINSKHKGRRGEQEVAILLRGWINEVYEELGLPLADMPKIERNLMQVGGMHRSVGQQDLIGLDWIAVEVKRVENEGGYQMREWWEQAKSQAHGAQEPILFWRLNGRTWNIKMYAFMMAGDTKIRAPVVITDNIFAVWFKHKLKSEILKQIVNTKI